MSSFNICFLSVWDYYLFPLFYWISLFADTMSYINSVIGEYLCVFKFLPLCSVAMNILHIGVFHQVHMNFSVCLRLRSKAVYQGQVSMHILVKIVQDSFHWLTLLLKRWHFVFHSSLYVYQSKYLHTSLCVCVCVCICVCSVLNRTGWYWWLMSGDLEYLKFIYVGFFVLLKLNN